MCGRTPRTALRHIRSQGLASMDWSRISANEAIELARVIDRLPRPV